MIEMQGPGSDVTRSFKSRPLTRRLWKKTIDNRILHIFILLSGVPHCVNKQ